MINLVYLQKCDHATELKPDYVVPKVSKKCLLFQEELLSITELLNEGIGTSLSLIKDIISLKQVWSKSIVNSIFIRFECKRS